MVVLDKGKTSKCIELVQLVVVDVTVGGGACLRTLDPVVAGWPGWVYDGTRGAPR